MPPQTSESESQPVPLPSYSSILLAVDSSDHANRGGVEAIALAAHFNSRITATHVYAAKLHDARFRQMEGGLPEQFREEQELERQRDVHDDLITRGLSIITDSYLDQVESAAAEQKLNIQRRALEGKNYRELANEANNGNYDLLVLGSLGLGAIHSSRLGSVCRRMARNAKIDTLVIKQPTRDIAAGPIVVALDGSAKSYGGLLTALSLAEKWRVEIKAVSAFDPYYHYVAFNRIAGVLSDEAGKVFKFKEQEKLHEEIIDSGLAKIYQGHLSVAQSIAHDFGVELETVLLDGKPHDIIARYLKEANPSLLIMGTTGIHADPDLDIGSNSEQLLQDAECAVLLSQREHLPQVDRLASVSTSWTREAERRMERVPSFVRPMAKMAILRYAQEQGHTVITESIVDQATAQLMPGHAKKAMEEIVTAYDNGELKRKPEENDSLRWDEEATRLLLSVKELSLRGNLSMRAEKRARVAGAQTITAEHIRPFLDEGVETIVFNPGTAAAQLPGNGTSKAKDDMHWQAAALARLMRVPEGFMRDSSKQRIEAYAHHNGHTEISLGIAEDGLAEAREAMQSMMQNDQAIDEERAGTPGNPQGSGCPFAVKPEAVPQEEQGKTNALPWSAAAEAMLNSVPVGFCQEMTRKAAQSIAGHKGLKLIDTDFISGILDTFKSGSQATAETMPWDLAARERIGRAPDMVRGMLIKEIEGWSRRKGLAEVNGEAVDAVKKTWAARGVFHLDPEDPRNL